MQNKDTERGIKKFIENLEKNAVKKLKTSKNNSNEIKKNNIDQLAENLRIHQIEIEMQNDELRRNEILLKETNDKYIDLYDFAPIGYLIFNKKGYISEANLMSASILGIERLYLINKNFGQFVSPDNIDTWHNHINNVLKYDEKQKCDLLLNNNVSTVYVRLDSIQLTSDDENQTIRSTMIEITEQKLLEEKLKRKDAIMNSSLNAMAISDMKGNLTYVNKAFIELWGYDFEHEILGKSVISFWDSEEDTLKVISELSKNKSWSGEMVALKKDGTRMIIQFMANLFQDNFGNSCAMMASFVDITNRKKMEDSIRKSETLLRNIIDSSTDYIYVKDKELKTVICNYVFAKALNKAPSDLVGKTDIENGWGEEMVKGNYEKGILGFEHDDLEALSGKIVKNPYEIAKIREEIRIFDTIKLPLKNEKNEIFGILGISRDATDRYRAEEKIKVLNEQFEMLMENTDDFITMQDCEGKYTFYNSVSRYGFSVNDIVGKTPFEIFDQVNAKKILLSLNQVSTECRLLSFESSLECKGEILWFSNHMYPVKDSQNKVISVGMIARDISEQKKYESELKSHRNQLEELVKERTLELLLSNEKLKDEIIERKTIAENLIQSKTILDSIADGVFTIDNNGIIDSFNKSAEIITGFNIFNVIGKHYSEIFKVDELFKNKGKEFLSKTDLVDQFLHIQNKNGKTIPINISTSELTDLSKNKIGFACIFRDLSKIENLRKTIEKDYTYQDIVSKNSEMQKIFNILPDIALSDSTVLIEGQTGTGKDLLAKAIHNISNRKKKHFGIINCGTLPPQLMESELFGYVKGAFTDAKSDREGKIAASNEGTIFFDEIGDLPFNLQVKLLRLLQNHEYEAVGSTKSVKCDIRVIAATNKDLSELVRIGKFRDDLYFRLNIVKIYLPSLYNRRDDIPYLIDHFIMKYNALKGKNITKASDDVINILVGYSFPGNIRELENIIEYSFITCKGNIIEVDNLPNEIRNKTNIIEISNTEKDQIISALEKYNGNKSSVCKELKISYATLFRKLKKYNIPKKII